MGVKGHPLHLALLVGAVLLCAPPVEAQPGVQTLTREDFARAGITRLSDLFDLAAHWSGVSTEGYHWDATPIGVGQPESWMLFVDSVPVDVRALGRQSINQLPISLTEICRVDFHAVPEVIGGIAAFSGAVHIHTCEAVRGIRVRGIAGFGNETGDPGPWRYTAFAVPNVDRTGPTVQGSILAAGARGHARIQARIDEHHATDPRIRQRVHTLYRGEKDARIQHRSGRFDVGWHQQRLVVAATHSEDLVYSDILGLEAPVNHSLSYGQLSGQVRPVRYFLKVSRNQILTRPNPEDLDVDFTHSTASGLASTTFSVGESQLNLGLQSDLSLSRFQANPNTRRVWRSRAFGQITMPWPASGRSSVFATARMDDRAPGYGAIGTIAIDNPRLHLTIAWSQRSQAARQDLAYWLRQGYRPGPSISLATNRPRTKFWSVDLAWQIRSRRTDLTIRTGVRRLLNLHHLSVDNRYDAATTRTLTQTSADYVSGLIGHVASSLRIKFSEEFRTAMNAIIAHPLTSHSGYQTHWKDRVRVHATADYAPNPRFTLHLRMYVRGSSYWAAYEEAARDGPEFYTDMLPTAVYADLAVQKLLWRDHLSISATLRNLLDHPVLMHPAGGRTRLSVHMRMAYRFTTSRRSGID